MEQTAAATVPHPFGSGHPGGTAMTTATVQESLVGLEPVVDSFIRELLDRSAAGRVPSLFAEPRPGLLYRVADRHGVTTVGLRTPSLTRDELIAILTYRLAQYAMAHVIDPRMIHARQLRHEPLSAVSENDVHFIAGAAGSGEILSYATLECVRDDSGTQTMATTDRALFPVESVFGPRLFHRLSVLRDLPVRRVAELGRATKNQHRPALDEATTRAPAEGALAMFRLLRGPLMTEIDAGIGDVEEGVAKKILDFFHIPTVLIRGVVPFVPEGSFGFFNYQHRTRYPFAFLCSDIPSGRLDAIERALELPGKEGLAALLALKRDRLDAASRLHPARGLPPLDDATVPQQGVAMSTRRQLLELGEWLRSIRLFRELSVAESAVLATLLEERAVEAGVTIVRQGEPGDGLFVIRSGTADVRVRARSGHRVIVRSLGPGDYFGEIALMTGGTRTADVVAMSPMTLLGLSHNAYARYLSQMVDVESELARTGLARTRDTLHLTDADE
jgi:hypothetical protein